MYIFTMSSFYGVKCPPEICIHLLVYTIEYMCYYKGIKKPILKRLKQMKQIKGT